MKTVSASPPSIFWVILLLCLPFHNALATHIRAGEITARSLGSQNLSYEIRLKIYADNNSPVILGANSVLDFGDGSRRQFSNVNDPNHPDYIARTLINDDSWLYELKITHSYPAAGSYTISYTEDFRNAGILNMENSEGMSFYLETVLSIDPFLGTNNTPVFNRFPLDKAFSGKTYHHQPGATDADGDSLSFELINNLQKNDTPVKQYRYPNLAFASGDVKNGSSETGGAPIFSINANTGDLIWDAPAAAGEFSVAFLVKEWRKVNGEVYLLSTVMRDMQIMVEEDSSPVPVTLKFPAQDQNLAPAAGAPVSWTITAAASNPSSMVTLELWGDFLNRTNAIASATSVQSQGEASITISWVGEAPDDQNYQLIARAFETSQPNHSRNRSAYIYYNPRVLGTDQASLEQVEVYPNPLSGPSFYLSIPKTAVGKSGDILIFDMKGKLMQQLQNIKLQKEHPLLLNKLSTGIYILQLNYGGQIYRQKVVVP